MQDVLAEVSSGRFAQELRREAESGYPRLSHARATSRAHAIERIFHKLRKLSEP